LILEGPKLRYLYKASNYLENYKLSITPSFDKFLKLLKTRGPMSSATVALELGITGEGARFQLTKLAEEGLIQANSESKGVGRPTQIWSLTSKGDRHFPDNHAMLSEQLIESMQEVLSPEQMDAVISLREKKANKKYIEALQDIPELEEKIKRLAELRNSDGYLAEWDKDGEAFILIENHCPVCAAAQRCVDLCDAEMNTFKEIFGENVSVERADHIIAGARRCAYKIRYVATQ
jgi:predicted ArsR family transcriptional regulator